MAIYRLQSRSHDLGSEGFAYFLDESSAMAERTRLLGLGYDPDDVSISSAKTPRSKREVVALLALWARHPDNG